MTRNQLAHCLRAAARIAGDPDILVIGSQAILGSLSEEELPDAASRSIEVDIAFLNEAGDPPKSDQVDGAIGENSQFHETFAYYAQGVEVTTASLPEGWRDRVVPFQPRDSLPARAVCLEKHDLVVSKLVAMREKDTEFAQALLEAGLVDVATLLDRAESLTSVPKLIQRRVLEWIKAAARRVKSPTP